MSSATPRPFPSSDWSERGRSQALLAGEGARQHFRKPVSGAMDLRGDVLHVVSVQGPVKRLAAHHPNPAFPERPDLLWIVGEEPDALYAKVPQYLDRSVVPPFVGAEAERAVRVYRIQPFLLQQVRSKLVAQTDAAPLLSEIEQDAPAALREDAQAAAQLFTAIAAEAAKEIPGQARRVESYRHRIRPALPVANHNRHVLEEAVGLAEADEGGILGVLQRNRSVADVGQLHSRVCRQTFNLRGRGSENCAAFQQVAAARAHGQDPQEC